MENFINVCIWILIVAMFAGAICLFWLFLRAKKRFMILKLNEHLLSSRVSLPEIFKGLTKLKPEDFDEKINLEISYLKTCLKQRFEKEILELKSFKMTSILISGLPRYWYKLIFPEFISVSLEQKLEHWAELYVISAEEDATVEPLIDQIIAYYQDHDKIKIYEKIIEKINLRLTTHFADSPLSEKKQVLQDLAEECRTLIIEI